ncbi:MAG: hypothetical protein AAFY60_08845, partial [Myxococcota bacterium]
YDALVGAIAKNEAPALASLGTPAPRLKLVAALVREAAAEYAIAVVDGKMMNAHEYQDAFGFTTVARGLVEGLPDGAAKADAAKTLDEVLGSMWPGLMPPEALSTAADQLHGAAAKIDLLAAGAS